MYQPVYVVAGVAMWLCAYEAGIHPTLAGVVMGLLAPATPFPHEPVTERLTRALHPWTSYLIVPLFALANAGIDIDLSRITSPDPVTLGVVVGLVVGKTVGITGASWLATRLGVGRLPTGTTWLEVVGIAALAGIGFTVSLFVAGLAFDDVSLEDDAKVGILVASVLAAALGSAVLAAASRRRAHS